jgi:hypothetical protein
MPIPQGRTGSARRGFAGKARTLKLQNNVKGARPSGRFNTLYTSDSRTLNVITVGEAA